MTITGGTVGADWGESVPDPMPSVVFGGGKGEPTKVEGNVTVNIGQMTTGEPPTYTGNATIWGSVYGGSAKGDVNAKVVGEEVVYSGNDAQTIVNIYKGTVKGSVYGGGEGEITPSLITAYNFGPTTVNIGADAATVAPTVGVSVYGGSNFNGISMDDVSVKVLSGTIGTESGVNDGFVHGGGYGQKTFVKGSVDVQIGNLNHANTPATIWGDVYGGSAEGHVNAYPVAEGADEDGRKYSTDKTTKVHLYAGTINGDAYGGGLGAVGKPASVGGNVLVELNGNTSATVDNDKKGCIVNNIFGCNNANGSPKGTVTVHIYKTQNAAATRITNPAKADPGDPDPTEKVKGRYDVAAVYGGGNRAAYRPTDAVNGKTEVVIEGCDETSIGYVYGGGNAAPVPATDVTILSSYEINYLFGGGNGAGVGNPGADVGIIDQVAYAANKATGTYGTGKAVTKLIGGTINYVYGGSNTKGNVRGGTSITMPYTNSCDLVIKEIYGAGQNAEQDGGVNMVLLFLFTWLLFIAIFIILLALFIILGIL